MLEAQELSVRYGAACVLSPVSFRVGEGEWLMVAGPNGAGKSTLLSALAQAVPYTGRVLLCGHNARALRPRQRARCMGLLSQSQRMSYAFTVEEVVRLGRYAYTGPLGGLAAQDEQAVDEALTFTGMQAYRGHSVLALSGGEVQRTFLAQVLAQQPRVLLLDEPTSHLDIAYQQQIFGLIQTWVKQPGRAVVSVVHDLSLARRYGTRALLLRGGHSVAEGQAAAALGEACLREAYGMDVQGWMRGLLAQWAGSEGTQREAGAGTAAQPTAPGAAVAVGAGTAAHASGAAGAGTAAQAAAPGAAEPPAGPYAGTPGPA